MSAEKEATLEVRNAIFEVADGLPFGAVMQGILMAQAKLAAATCDGDEIKTTAVLAEYHAVMMRAVPIYCVEVQTGQLVPS